MSFRAQFAHIVDELPEPTRPRAGSGAVRAAVGILTYNHATALTGSAR